MERISVSFYWKQFVILREFQIHRTQVLLDRVNTCDQQSGSCPINAGRGDAHLMLWDLTKAMCMTLSMGGSLLSPYGGYLIIMSWPQLPTQQQQFQQPHTLLHIPLPQKQGQCRHEPICQKLISSVSTFLSTNQVTTSKIH